MIFPFSIFSPQNILKTDGYSLIFIENLTLSTAVVTGIFSPQVIFLLLFLMVFEIKLRAPHLRGKQAFYLLSHSTSSAGDFISICLPRNYMER
jgi:hypothetical protein